MSNLFDLSGRTALVTGSSQGIGLSLARGLADAGAAVILNGRDRAKLEAAAAEIPGSRILAFDVTARPSTTSRRPSDRSTSP
jgi:gluconate 5-dehydrogenase